MHTLSLYKHKYADPLLDLLELHQVVQTRLFRESCTYYEGYYVKDLSHINYDLFQLIIVDNSPASYLFYPEDTIICPLHISDSSD